MTVNVGVVDLGHVDLLVQEGFYSNRSDLMRTALRNQLALHADTVKQTVARRTLMEGLQHYSRADLETVVAAGQRLHVQVVGVARIADIKQGYFEHFLAAFMPPFDRRLQLVRAWLGGQFHQATSAVAAR